MRCGPELNTGSSGLKPDFFGWKLGFSGLIPEDTDSTFGDTD